MNGISGSNRIDARTGLVGALVLAGLGQASVLGRHFTTGAILYGTAAILFVALLRVAEGPQPAIPIADAPEDSAVRWGFLWLLPFAFAFLGFAVRGVLVPRSGTLGMRLLVPAWILALGLFLVSVLGAVRWRPGGLRGLRESLRTHRVEIAGVGLLVLLALVLRTIALVEHPYPFVNDEGAVGLQAASVLAERQLNLFRSGWSGFSLLGFLPYSASELAFGRGVLAVRFVSALEGTLSVLLVYLLGRQIAGKGVGFFAAGFVATLPLHLHFSRLGVPNVVDSLTGPLVLALTLRAVRRRRVAGYVWAGVAAGAAFHVYVGSRLVIALAVGVLGWELLRQRGFLRTQWAGLLAFVGALVFATAPTAAYFAKEPGQFMGRIHSQSILFNGWLRDTAAGTGRTELDILREQFSKTLGGFFVNPAVAGFFNSSRPYLFPVAAVFCVLGMAYAASRIRQTGYLLLLVWFWAVVILGGTLMLAPPSSERLIQSVTPLAVFFGLGVWKLAEGLSRLGVARRLAVAGCAAVVGLTGLQGVGYYFGEYRSRGYFGNEVDESIQEIARKARPMGPAYRLFLIGMPSTFHQIPNFEFLLPDVEKEDVEGAAPEIVGRLPRDRGAFFAALPNREGTLREIARLVPGGEWKAMRRTYHDEAAFLSYVVPPDRMAALGPVSAPPGSPAPAVAGPPPDGRETVEIDGATVEVAHSDLDGGRIQDLFDGRGSTLARTKNSNVFLVDLRFAPPKKISSIEVTTGSMNVQLKASLSVTGRTEPAVYEKTYRQLAADPTVMLDLGGTHEVERARIEIGNADGGDGHVHVREVLLK